MVLLRLAPSLLRSCFADPYDQDFNLRFKRTRDQKQMLLEDTSTFPAVWGQVYEGEGNPSWNRASPRSIINRCITGKERDGRQHGDSFVSLSKSPSSRLQRAGTGALMQRHHVREMETFHVVNPQVVRENLMRKETSVEHPGLLGRGGTGNWDPGTRPGTPYCWHPFFTVLPCPWEVGSSLRAQLTVVEFDNWFKCLGQVKRLGLLYFSW